MEKESETSNTRDFVTTSEAAEALGVSYYTVYEYIKEKRLVAEMVGGIYMIPKKPFKILRQNQPDGYVRIPRTCESIVPARKFVEWISVYEFEQVNKNA